VDPEERERKSIDMAQTQRKARSPELEPEDTASGEVVRLPSKLKLMSEPPPPRRGMLIGLGVAAVIGIALIMYHPEKAPPPPKAEPASQAVVAQPASAPVAAPVAAEPPKEEPKPAPKAAAPKKPAAKAKPAAKKRK
jgi:hypothetical protein